MIVIGWIFIAILCGVVANNKNRSVLGWLLLGGLFGIFAFILLLFLPTIKIEEAKN